MGLRELFGIVVGNDDQLDIDSAELEKLNNVQESLGTSSKDAKFRIDHNAAKKKAGKQKSHSGRGNSGPEMER